MARKRHPRRVTRAPSRPPAETATPSSAPSALPPPDPAPSPPTALDSIRADQLELQERFLEAFRSEGTVYGAARLANINRDTHYYWLESDSQGYVARFRKAEDDSLDILEREARRRALVGIEEPIIYEGRTQPRRDPATGKVLLDDHGRPMLLTVNKKSDTLLMFLLNGRRSDIFRHPRALGAGEKPVGSGSTGSAVSLLPAPGASTHTTPAQRRQRAKVLIQRMATLAGLRVTIHEDGDVPPDPDTADPDPDTADIG